MIVLCFSHLRWKFVYQRPQHLMTRFANESNVFYFEEHLFHNYDDDYLVQSISENLKVIVPHLNREDTSDYTLRIKAIIDKFIGDEKIKNYISWFYTPIYFFYTDHLRPVITVYDCMDELSAFKFAPPELKIAEQNLLNKADVVFTGGYSLYKAKKHLHGNIHAFPSSIDKKHFEKARTLKDEPGDQKNIPHPRLGFYGVIDERFDIELIKSVADAKPQWQFILIGPVIKINHDSLPKNDNIHYLGGRNYDQLPEYLSGWDIALIPFAINESTKYISPTKTPEYLAAGKPVISTAIEDVIHPYEDEKLVHIIHSPEEFISAASKELNNNSREKWLKKTDAFLAGISWDKTWNDMQQIIISAIQFKQQKINKKQQTYV